MSVSIRRLGPGDEGILAHLAVEDADFDIPDRGKPLAPLSAQAAKAYLSDPHVLHWVAEQEGKVIGDVYCHVLRKRAGDPLEVLLYEIGVEKDHRQAGVGRMLMEAILAWMKANRVKEIWVLADNPGAAEFYEKCGFSVHQPAPVYMTKELQ